MNIKLGDTAIVDGIEMLLFGVNDTIDGRRFDFQYWNDGRIEHFVVSERELQCHVVKEAK